MRKKDKFNAERHPFQYTSRSTKKKGGCDEKGDDFFCVGGVFDSGQYQIRDGKFCSKWKTLRSGAERCVILFKVGENHYQAFYMDGSKNSDLYFQ